MTKTTKPHPPQRRLISLRVPLELHQQLNREIAQQQAQTGERVTLSEYLLRIINARKK